jgi:predicted DNA-binding protein
MANSGKILSIRITTKQSKYLSNLDKTTHKPFSDLIRDIIQQHI